MHTQYPPHVPRPVVGVIYLPASASGVGCATHGAGSIVLSSGLTVSLRASATISSLIRADLIRIPRTPPNLYRASLFRIFCTPCGVLCASRNRIVSVPGAAV